MQSWSIVSKIVVSTCGIIAILLLLGGYILVKFEREMISSFANEHLEKLNQTIDEKAQEVKESLQNDVRVKAKILSQVSALHLFNFSSNDLYPTLKSYMEYPEIVAIQFMDITNAPFAAAWKFNGIKTGVKIPDSFKTDGLFSISRDCPFQGEPAGSFTMYYTESLITEKIKLEKEKAESEKKSFQNNAHSHLNRLIINQSIGVFLIFMIMVTLLILSLRALILKRINKVSDIARQLAAYDISLEIKENYKDEIGGLFSAINNIIISFREILSMVTINVDKTDSSVIDIQGAVEDQASVLSQQSASVSQITSTMSELSASSSQIAEHSNSVVRLADNALKIAEEGAASVEQIMNKMEEINMDNQKNVTKIVELGRKSKEIAKVMDVINDISDQTKLIAFNAAIEATSAGEAGKRFSVVAVEIRRLADSVMESTSDIENKIMEILDAVDSTIIDSETGSKRIQEGLEDSAETVDMLQSIVRGAKDTTDAAKQISLSTQQQKTANEQILTALREIDQGGKQNIDSIKQIGIIVKDLKQLSDNLKDIVDRFILAKE